ncbi:MAG: hypothetical protein LAT67_12440 [Balneolales bacterium]|nr:hypothetical protein [Balneolales bacterium]
MKRNLSLLLPLLIFMLPLLQHCGKQTDDAAPAPISGLAADRMPYNDAICAFSGEQIRTARYGARVVNGTETLLFRSVEDMAGWLKANNKQPESLRLHVVDFIDGKRFIEVHEAVYLYSKLRPSPGGHHLSALDKSNEHMIQRVYEAYPGRYLSWEEMLALF